MHMRDMLLKLLYGLDTPLPLLGVNHRSGHKEAMAAGGRANACNIKMWPTVTTVRFYFLFYAYLFLSRLLYFESRDFT